MARTKVVSRFDPETGGVVTERVSLSPGEEVSRDAEEADATLDIARNNARQRIVDHGQGLIMASFPRLPDWEMTEAVLGTIAVATLPAARSQALIDAIAVYQYGRSKAGESASWTLAEANAYDPATDPGWP